MYANLAAASANLPHPACGPSLPKLPSWGSTVVGASTMSHISPSRLVTPWIAPRRECNDARRMDCWIAAEMDTPRT